MKSSRCLMVTGGACLVVGACIALAGCGGHDFSGTYTGDVHRVNQMTNADVTAPELVVVDASEQTLHWTRGSALTSFAVINPTT